MTQRVPLPVGPAIEERRRTVDEIRRRVGDGTYRVDPEAVAAAVLEALREARRR